jgi:hypothetical protein
MRKSILFSLLVLATTALADEGMWLFNRPPRQLLKQRYNFEPTQVWLDHLQKASVRFNSGGSGSFVSSDGLILTNHHVGLDCLQKISTAAHDYVTTGYHAKTNADEVKCVDLELNVLMNIEDVTQRVNAAVTQGMSSADATRARRAVMNTIEKESLDKTGLRSDVVTLYQGGEYHLYRSKKYTDVRLVFAPEVAIAFFGGDPDNFEYPRYDLDICFFRAYENGRPAKVTDYLRWSTAGSQDGDLVFVSGHPGGTNRLNTLTHLLFFRDVQYPFVLNTLRRREILLNTYSERSVENDRRSHDDLFGIKNSRKLYVGRIAGLQDPAVIKTKADSEAVLRQRVSSDPQLNGPYGDAWQIVDNAINTYYRPGYIEYRFLEGSFAFNSHLFGIARTLQRLADESAKPNGERLREYRESNLESLKQFLYSEAPIYDDLETLELADSLSHWLEVVGPDDPLVRQVLNGKSPLERASDLVRTTKLKDVAERKRLGEGGKAVTDASNDPMLLVARLVDPRSRELRKTVEDNVQEPLRQAYAKIANAVFRTSGGETYPDATFTLRLAIGTVKGYDENGQHIPAFTNIAGTFQHSAEHKNHPPFDLPQSWLKKKTALDGNTSMNFVSTADIIGGNSGSPVVNRAGEFVGIIFDGNLQSLPWDYQFDDRQGRAVSVDSRAILEALRKVYTATNVVTELTEK